jgi:hypothetical protein
LVWNALSAFVGAAQLTVVASYIIESSRLKVSRALISFEWWSFRTRVMARVSIVGTRKCGIKTRTFQLILEKIAAAVDSTDNRITIDTLEPIVKVAGYVFEIRGRGFGTNRRAQEVCTIFSVFTFYGLQTISRNTTAFLYWDAFSSFIRATKFTRVTVAITREW